VDYESVDHKEAETLRETLNYHVDEVSLLQRVLGDYLPAFAALDGYRIQDQSEELILALLIKAFNSLKCAHDLLLKGHYGQCLTLVRTVEEDWLTCIYVNKHREKAKLWLKGRRTPSFACMRLDLDEDFRKKVAESYGILSTFAHPRLRSIVVSMDREPGNISLRLGGKYDRDHFTAAIYSMIGSATDLLGIPAIFLHEKEPAWFAQINDTQAVVIKWLRKVNEDVKAKA